jgi:hypothetical protein
MTPSGPLHFTSGQTVRAVTKSFSGPDGGITVDGVNAPPGTFLIIKECRFSGGAKVTFKNSTGNLLFIGCQFPDAADGFISMDACTFSGRCDGHTIVGAAFGDAAMRILNSGGVDEKNVLHVSWSNWTNTYMTVQHGKHIFLYEDRFLTPGDAAVEVFGGTSDFYAADCGVFNPGKVGFNFASDCTDLNIFNNHINVGPGHNGIVNAAPAAGNIVKSNWLHSKINQTTIFAYRTIAFNPDYGDPTAV